MMILKLMQGRIGKRKMNAPKLLENTMNTMRFLFVTAAVAMMPMSSAYGSCIDEDRLKWNKRVQLKTAKQIERLDVKDIAWGKEDAKRRMVGRIDPPQFTPDPMRVEVLYFVDYVSTTSRCADRLFGGWRDSLPPEVDVRIVPNGQVGWKRGPLHYEGEIHQALVFLGELLGRKDEVHDAVIKRIEEKGDRSLDSTHEADLLLEGLGIEKGTFAKYRYDPEVLGLSYWAIWAKRRLNSASHVLMGKKGKVALYPALAINGRYTVNTANTRDPGKTFRIANRIIREELERGRSHDGPTNNDELAKWLAPRAGEILQISTFGVMKGNAVYNASRRELWLLGKAGEVFRAVRIIGEGDASRAISQVPGKRARHVPIWRSGRQLVSYEGKGGPQRYGAFLLTDWLSAPETHWVEFPWKGHRAGLAFSPDGTVEARNERGPVFGSWWLEAGKLHVSLGELGIESWPWMEVADMVGFEVPQESVTPWKRGR
jgi:hypothetical protein